jgi:predicted nucleotidyltransferase
MQHHEETLAAYVESVRSLPETLGVVLVGSVCRGTERPDSDVDVYRVITDEAFEVADATERLSYSIREISTYDGGYVDIKECCPSYLAEALDHGDEPTRASFVGARVAYSTIPDLAQTVAAIPTLSDEEWHQREMSFISQLRLYFRYFLAQGEKLDDAYLLHWAAVHGVNAASRALLAHGRILFRGAKYSRTLLADLPDLPAGFLEDTADLLAAPTFEKGAAISATIEGFKDWGIADEQSLSRFIRDNELAWLKGTLPPESM